MDLFLCNQYTCFRKNAFSQDIPKISDSFLLRFIFQRTARLEQHSQILCSTLCLRQKLLSSPVSSFTILRKNLLTELKHAIYSFWRGLVVGSFVCTEDLLAISSVFRFHDPGLAPFQISGKPAEIHNERFRFLCR